MLIPLQTLTSVTCQFEVVRQCAPQMIDLQFIQLPQLSSGTAPVSVLQTAVPTLESAGSNVTPGINQRDAKNPVRLYQPDLGPIVSEINREFQEAAA